MIGNNGLIKHVHFFERYAGSDDDNFSDDGIIEFDASSRLVVHDAALMKSEVVDPTVDEGDADDIKNNQIKSGVKR
jgi:hypothetical protein